MDAARWTCPKALRLLFADSTKLAADTYYFSPHTPQAMSSFFNNQVGVAAIAAATTATAYVLYRAFDKSKPYSTLTLRGPLSPSYLKGHQELIIDYDIDQLEE